MAALEPAIMVALRERLRVLFPDWTLESIESLAPDSGATADAALKAEGYGKPVRLHLVDASGASRDLVWRVVAANEFGHDRRADRAAATLLAYDDFARIPQHVRAHEVGAISSPGRLLPLPDACELYLVTDWAPGAIYAEDLRRLTREHVASDTDHARVRSLARYLAELHAPSSRPGAYRRAIRDLVGHGEGIFGIIDGYPRDVEGASSQRLHDIERRCVRWRWILREHEDRAARIHGDFHPFNIVFDGPRFTLLDASRGTVGEPADDLTALAVNFVLFALDQPASWRRGLGPLWHALWGEYQAARRDPRLFAMAPPFFAWRALVVCNPRFYPGLRARARDALLGLATRVLDEQRLEPSWADELFP